MCLLDRTRMSLASSTEDVLTVNFVVSSSILVLIKISTVGKVMWLRDRQFLGIVYAKN